MITIEKRYIHAFFKVKNAIFHSTALEPHHALSILSLIIKDGQVFVGVFEMFQLGYQSKAKLV